jgi:tetratricopeptide (TPR) repeat protein/MFS family permease
MTKTPATSPTLLSSRLLIPSLTVFITSFCIMVLELVAGRLVARFLGSSLYTWTSVIGVVLAGITLGNYFGGIMADKFESKKTLAWMFTLSSITCVIVIILNNIVGSWAWLWDLNWSTRVFLHVSIVFLLPSTLLGTISPIVAKLALDQHLPAGKTVGKIYACGAAGSIAGTFAAGYWLIAAMGSVEIIWAIAATLLGMAVFYQIRLRFIYVWAPILTCALVMGMGPWEWTEQSGSKLALRMPVNETIIYEDETNYGYVAVKQLSSAPDHRIFMQDKLKHSEIIMGDEQNLQYFYAHIFAAITHGRHEATDKISTLAIGGGGYVFPRYIEKLWPNSVNHVVEIDPGVTKAAIEAFGLSADTAIKTFKMDGRNYVDGILEQKERDGMPIRYDYIYEDAFNDYNIPYQLTTRQFNDKISQLLTDDGVYMINLIDVFESGKFIGAIISTLQESFDYVYVTARGDISRKSRSTFAVIAAKQSLDVEGLCTKYGKKNQYLWHLDSSEIQTLKQKADNLILTDNYAPVGNLIAPVAQISAAGLLATEHFKEATLLLHDGDLDAAIEKLKQVMDIDPTTSLRMYNEIGMIYFKQRKWIEAAGEFERSLVFIKDENLMVNTANIHYNLAEAFKNMGKKIMAGKHFQVAVEQYHLDIEANPKSAMSHLLFAKSLVALENYELAGKLFMKAVNLNPTDMNAHMELVKNLQTQGKLETAVKHLEAASLFMSRNGKGLEAVKLKQYLQILKKQTTPK